jgi:hypothetical protein
MTDWCSNIVSIQSEDEKKVEEVMNFIGDSFDFDKIIPYPEILKQRDEEYEEIDTVLKPFYGDGFLEKQQSLPAYIDYVNKWGTGSSGYQIEGAHWCYKNWGTNWNVGKDAHIEDGRIICKTAWTPPEPIIVKLSEMFPEVIIRMNYVQEEIRFAGKLVCKNSERIICKHVDLDHD